jgi:hypothetical protein
VKHLVNVIGIVVVVTRFTDSSFLCARLCGLPFADSRQGALWAGRKTVSS